MHSGNFVNSLSTLGGRNFDVIYVCSDSLRVGELQKVTDSASFSNSFKPFVIALVIDPTVKKLVCVKHQGAQGYLCPPFDGRRLLSKFTYVKNLRQA